MSSIASFRLHRRGIFIYGTSRPFLNFSPYIYIGLFYIVFPEDLPMNKLELTNAVGDEAQIKKSEAAAVVNLFFNKMVDALANGDRIEIRRLCSFYVKKYKPYTGRNPKTGKRNQVNSKKLPFFKPGAELRERVDNK
jgi:integration host factor subunit beta